MCLRGNTSARCSSSQRLDYFKGLAVKVKMLLLDISDLVWERRGGGEKVMKALLDVGITRERTEFARMQRALGLSSCKRKNKI